MEFDYVNALTHITGHVMKLHRHNLDLLIQKYDVYPGQPPLLMRLYRHGGMMQKDLARSMNVQPATLTVMINRMEKSGLVTRQADPNDQRVSRVYLTEKGKVATRAVKEALQLLETRCFENFTDEETALLRNMLTRLHTDLEAFQLEYSEKRSGDAQE
ncbi:MarR family transcriptional regulator [Brevibacillus centrosporus]|uniref:MarR family winged helix-turn-helix transcriptional regulator n=1 Tax=Brevibacillus centrosporus TaxID=54910 RepID=UPI000F09CF67|nr:MarR family transcriptional regulator [Brevibacillus centrosporus]RNB73614.1 MarR family transcriptional regulator [Brevibacillus centrosporus]GED29123.1 MarR family transcriptional regulator [Brevibacillus centrosporus]